MDTLEAKEDSKQEIFSATAAVIQDFKDKDEEIWRIQQVIDAVKE